MDNASLPPLLREIPDTPKQLYMQGSLPDPEHYTYLTVIGSRKYTQYGKNACETLIKGLRGYPVAIVSGMALGMDTIAHEMALEVGLPTVALPGSGLEQSVLYPATNTNLARRILDTGGALVSEFEPTQKAAQWTFPRRNRIMAGISRATLVIEAANKSGTRITARLAMEYNRDVLVVPGSIFSEASSGTNQLIKEGAAPVTTSNELLEELGFSVTETTPEDAAEHCSPEEKKVLSLLVSPMARGELIRSLELPTHEANTLLSAMELKGLITETLGEVRRT